VLVVYRNGALALASLGTDTFSKLADAALSIAGPLSLSSATLLALDGKLVQLVDGAQTPLADDHNVVCLAEHNGLDYACEREGISRITAGAVGAPLFRFNWLQGPDLQLVPEGEPRQLCNMQWQDLLFDMQLAMLEPASAVPEETLVTGAQQAAGTAGGAALEPPVHERSASCALSPIPAIARRGAADAYPFGLLLVVATLRYRTRRRDQKPRSL
jgi:hypothetical protein